MAKKLTSQQEDFIIEEGLERLRELKEERYKRNYEEYNIHSSKETKTQMETFVGDELK